MVKKKYFVLIVIAIIALSICVYFYLKGDVRKDKDANIISKNNISNVVEKFNKTMVTNKDCNVYSFDNNEYSVIGSISNGISLILDDSYEINSNYYKILGTDYYVLYEDVDYIEAIDNGKFSEFTNFNNYVPFNENIVTLDSYKLYIDDNKYINLNVSGSYNILIKDDDKYGIKFNDRLFFISKDDVKDITSGDINESFAESIGVLNYHYVIGSGTEEEKECTQQICITDSMFDKHLSYLKDNGYYTATMRDLELWLDKKIQLPEKTVVITIDDGWYVARSITLLEKYQLNATLFLIGSLASPSAYQSNYLEIHSHTWNMHNIGDCSGHHGGAILCKDDQFILDDLKKSRESLNNTPYFCYPFYEYNNNSERLLKEAGFRMAFIGGEKKATQDINKYRIPRYVVVDYTTMDDFINMIS